MARKLRLILFSTIIFSSLLLVIVSKGSRFLSYMSVGLANSSRLGAQSSSPAASGSWSQVYNTKDVPVHISLLPDGRLLYWGRDKTNEPGNPARDGLDVTGYSNTYWLDPLYLDHPNYTTTKLNTTTNLFCAGHTFLPDGRLLVTGGHRRADSTPSASLPPGAEFREGLGDRGINIFNYKTDEWNRQAEMDFGRWYPFNVTLGTGETLIMAGTYWSNEGESQAPRSSLNREIEIRDLQGNLRKLTTDGSSPQTVYYPYLSLTPQGKVFISKPGPSSDAFETSRMIDPYAPHPSGQGFGVYSIVGTPAEKHFEGTSVMYEPGKVLLVGGSAGVLGGGQSANAEYIDFNEATPQWRGAGSMSWARQYSTSTVLPDGNVLITGGTSCPGVNVLSCPNGAVHAPELWNPTNRTFQQMAATPSQIPRVYHSMALLLSDGRVLIGGGGLPAAEGEIAGGTLCHNATGSANPIECRKFGHKDVEIFSPPYLYDSNGALAVRPVITNAPETVSYGQTINIGIGDVSTSDIKEVVLIRLPSVTHTFNQDQRRVRLGTPTATSSDSISVIAPANGNICPPGPYMMFLIRNNGRNTPSEAKIIRVGNLSLDSTSKAFSSTGTGTSRSTFTVKNPGGLNWTAQPDSPWIRDISVNLTNGTVTFSVDSNTTPTGPPPPRRQGKIIISVPGQQNSNKYEFIVYQAGTFNDINYPGANQFFIDAINNIYARSITTGCGTGAYCPTSSVTRAEMAVFLTRILLGNRTPPEPLTQRFDDVPLSSTMFPYGWARPYIEYIARRNITGGCSTNPSLFCPGDSVTRAQMAVFLLRTLGLKTFPPVSAPPFNDVDVNHWAAPYIQELARRGITAGCDNNNNFCPEAPVTREQMAAFMVRAFKL